MMADNNESTGMDENPGSTTGMAENQAAIGQAGLGVAVEVSDETQEIAVDPGDDFLFGGAGADELSVGTGDDVFFSDGGAIAEGAGLTNHDVILDYAAGDTIDLDALFDILEPTGASRLDVVTTSTGDLDGDGADTKITVRDASDTAVTDFSIVLEDYSASLDIDPGDHGSV